MKVTTLLYGLKNQVFLTEENEDALKVSRTLNAAPPVRSPHS